MSPWHVHFILQLKQPTSKHMMLIYTNLSSNMYRIDKQGSTCGGIYLPCIYSHARWELPQVTQVFVVVSVCDVFWALSNYFVSWGEEGGIFSFLRMVPVFHLFWRLSAHDLFVVVLHNSAHQQSHRCVPPRQLPVHQSTHHRWWRAWLHGLRLANPSPTTSSNVSLENFPWSIVDWCWWCSLWCKQSKVAFAPLNRPACRNSLSTARGSVGIYWKSPGCLFILITHCLMCSVL